MAICLRKDTFLGLLLGAAAGLPAAAAPGDTLQPFLAASHLYDDNLLRLPDDAPGFDGARSDTARQVQGGILFERPLGRQILSGQAKFSRVAFDRFRQLDYNGKDLLAALEWHVGDHLEGHAGAGAVRTLASFSDFHSSERNLRLQRHDYVDAAWRLHPSWRVRGGVTRDRYTYDLALQHFNNRDEDGVELGLDYLAASGSVAGLRLRRGKTHYPDPRLFGALVLDDDFRQNEIKANIDWRFSGVTRLQFLGGWVERKHVLDPLRDAKGANGRAIADWAPFGKLGFTGTVWREFGAVESTLLNSSLNQGVSLGARWDASEKLRVDAQLKREKRDFGALSGIVLAGAATDTSRGATLGLTYAPQRFLQIGLSVFRDSRAGSASIGSGSYRAKGAGFNLSAQF